VRDGGTLGLNRLHRLISLHLCYDLLCNYGWGDDVVGRKVIDTTPASPKIAQKLSTTDFDVNNFDEDQIKHFGELRGGVDRPHAL